MDRKTTLALLALLVAAVGTTILVFRMSNEQAPPPPAPRLAGYYARDARLTGTDDDGHILYRAAAATVTQNPAEGNVALERVVIHYDPPGSVPWVLTSDAGTIPPGGKMFALSGNVIATAREADAPPATIRTDYLEFDNTTGVASTNRKVDIEYAGSTVHATGLRALLRENKVQLLSSVTGRYLPPPRQ